MGRRQGAVPAGGRPDRRRAAHEEVHVGAVLVGAPAVLQVPVHSVQGEAGRAAGARRNQERESESDSTPRESFSGCVCALLFSLGCWGFLLVKPLPTG